MEKCILVSLLLIIIIVLFYTVCSLRHPEIKAKTYKYSDYNTRTRSNLLFSMDTNFAITRIVDAFFGKTNPFTEYEYFLHSIDLFCNAVPYGISLITYWICVSLDFTILTTIAICLIVFTFAIMSLYIPKGTVIQLYYHLVGTLYKFTNTLWLNKIISIIILIVINKPVMIIAFLVIQILQFPLQLIISILSVHISGVSTSDAAAYNILGHIIKEHHSVFEWVKLNRQYIDENYEHTK